MILAHAVIPRAADSRIDPETFTARIECESEKREAVRTAPVLHLEIDGAGAAAAREANTPSEENVTLASINAAALAS